MIIILLTERSRGNTSEHQKRIPVSKRGTKYIHFIFPNKKCFSSVWPKQISKKTGFIEQQKIQIKDFIKQVQVNKEEIFTKSQNTRIDLTLNAKTIIKSNCSVKYSEDSLNQICRENLTEVYNGYWLRKNKHGWVKKRRRVLAIVCLDRKMIGNTMRK